MCRAVAARAAGATQKADNRKQDRVQIHVPDHTRAIHSVCWGIVLVRHGCARLPCDSLRSWEMPPLKGRKRAHSTGRVCEAAVGGELAVCVAPGHCSDNLEAGCYEFASARLANL